MQEHTVIPPGQPRSPAKGSALAGLVRGLTVEREVLVEHRDHRGELVAEQRMQLVPPHLVESAPRGSGRRRDRRKAKRSAR